MEMPAVDYKSQNTASFNIHDRSNGVFMLHKYMYAVDGFTAHVLTMKFSFALVYMYSSAGFERG